MDDEIVDKFIYKKRTCIILAIRQQHYCAYAETKLKDVDYNGSNDGLSPESIMVCHGGVTYSGELQKGKWFFGFDFAHYNDSSDLLCSGVSEGHKWTKNEVKEKLKLFVNQIIRYEKWYPKISKLRIKQQKEFELLKQKVVEDG